MIDRRHTVFYDLKMIKIYRLLVKLKVIIDMVQVNDSI